MSSANSHWTLRVRSGRRGAPWSCASNGPKRRMASGLAAQSCMDISHRRGAWRGLGEPLVVIAVIVLLAALIFPIFAEARERARRATCLSHLRQIDQAYLLYVADWDEQLPDWYGPGPPRPAPFGPRQFWPELLQPY